MKRRRQPSTIAAILDATSWDYTPARDGRLLLAPLGRLFASVSWEYDPQHLGIAPRPARIPVRRPDGGGTIDSEPADDGAANHAGDCKG